jgi:hypothetical protein
MTNTFPSVLTIDGVQYSTESMGPAIRNTVGLMEITKQKLEAAQKAAQAAQVEVAVMTAAYNGVGAQLRDQLAEAKRPVSTAPKKTAKKPARALAKKNQQAKR